MTRKEVIGDSTLYLGDCMEILPTLPKVDAVITDPPYGIDFAARPTKYQRRAGQPSESWDEIAPEDAVQAVIKKGDTAIVWGGNYFQLPVSRCWLIWHKPDGPQSFSRLEMAWTNMDKLSQYFKWTVAATRDGEGYGYHPTQKPEQIMRWCLDQAGVTAPKTVLDPFMGSGTTGVAAAQIGAGFIGIEREAKYFDIACQRIEQAYKQRPLFEAELTRKPEQLGLETT